MSEKPTPDQSLDKTNDQTNTKIKNNNRFPKVQFFNKSSACCETLSNVDYVLTYRIISAQEYAKKNQCAITDVWDKLLSYYY